MELTKEEIAEWHSNPVTQEVKERFDVRLRELGDLSNLITIPGCCEHIALAVVKQAGITEGIKEVLNYGKD